MTWLYIWFAIIAVSLVVEFITMKFISVWISVGALCAMILSVFGVHYLIQIVVMIVVSVACLLGLRKVTIKFLNKDKNKQKIKNAQFQADDLTKKNEAEKTNDANITNVEDKQK